MTRPDSHWQAPSQLAKDSRPCVHVRRKQVSLSGAALRARYSCGVLSMEMIIRRRHGAARLDLPERRQQDDDILGVTPSVPGIGPSPYRVFPGVNGGSCPFVSSPLDTASLLLIAVDSRHLFLTRRFHPRFRSRPSSTKSQPSRRAFAHARAPYPNLDVIVIIDGSKDRRYRSDRRFAWLREDHLEQRIKTQPCARVPIAVPRSSSSQVERGNGGRTNGGSACHGNLVCAMDASIDRADGTQRMIRHSFTRLMWSRRRHDSSSHRLEVKFGRVIRTRCDECPRRMQVVTKPARFLFGSSAGTAGGKHLISSCASDFPAGIGARAGGIADPRRGHGACAALKRFVRARRSGKVARRSDPGAGLSSKS